jgi:hypothetical protein
MPRLIDTERWDCPNHAHCGARAYIKTYDCGCVKVEWQNRGTYDPSRCAPNPEGRRGPRYPHCDE